MAFLKALLRKIPWLHRFLSGVYRRIKPSHVKNMWHYRTKIAPTERKKLKSCGFSGLRCFKPLTWRFGRGIDHAYRRYYLAIYQGEKVFIKVAMNDSTICNEIDVGSRLISCDALKGGRPIVSDKAFAPATMMMAMRFNKGLESFHLPQSMPLFETLCQGLLELLEILDAEGIIHADIHKNNLMLDEQGNPVLLDYGISMVRGEKNQVNYKARPGTFFRESLVDGKQIRVYDDAYSMVQMLEKLSLPEGWKECPAYQKIAGRIGKLEGRVEI